MPFTIGGDWVPSQPERNGPKKLVKVRLVKKGNSIVTVIFNLDKTSKELEAICSHLKKNLGCGGTVKNKEIEIQGDKVLAVEKFLKSL